MPTTANDSSADSAERSRSLAPDDFAEFLLDLHQNHWSGIVSIDAGIGTKRIYFNNGEICFAASNIIDDKLGEVIYRNGMISLDQMLAAAVKVNRRVKFGQVLLQNGVFTVTDIWRALKLQVQEILQSVFFLDAINFQLKDGKGLAPTQVVFKRGARQLIQECANYGRAYKEFAVQLGISATLIANESQLANTAFSGTFAGEFLQLVKDNPKPEDLFAASKLSEQKTTDVVIKMAKLGLVNIETNFTTDAFAPGVNSTLLNSKVNLYSTLLPKVVEVFSGTKTTFPAQALQQFAADLNLDGLADIVVQADGTLSASCLMSAYAQCKADAKRAAFFEVRIESLIQFLLQIAHDLLPSEQAQNIRDTYKSLTS